MSYIFEFSVFYSFLILLVAGILNFAIGYLFLRIFEKYTKTDALSIPIGAFIGTIATAWALSLGFVAADIWSINLKADEVANQERSAIYQISNMASPQILDSQNLSLLMSEYSQTVSEKEWLQSKNTEPLDSVEDILQRINEEIANLSAKKIPDAFIFQLMNNFDQLQNARNERISIGTASIDLHKWYLLFMLTVLTTITIVSAHADRRNAAIKAIIIYSITASLCIWILSMKASPYQGAVKLEPDLYLIKKK